MARETAWVIERYYTANRRTRAVKALFVGGPDDGVMRDLEQIRDRERVRVPVRKSMAEMLARNLDQDANTSMPIEDVIYLRHDWYGIEGDSWCFYAPEGWNASRIMESLINYYSDVDRRRRERR